jgi:hypothetical protein
MGSRLRALLEALMPWYSAKEAHDHDRRTEAIRQRSVKARETSERVRDLATAKLGSYQRVRVR